MARLAKHHAPKVTLAAMAVRPNILIVDDRKENLLATEKILRHLDAGIFQANSGNEALSLVLRHKFAIILLDVQMPEMDGFETAMLMQEHESMRGVPIIFVTAISKEERYATQAAEIGAVDYIFKPINPEILKSKVQVYLDLYVQREQILKLNTSLQKSNEELERFAYNRGLLEAAPDAMVVVSRAEKSS
jgi:two-component system sensor histidine kinase/response regulator